MAVALTLLLEVFYFMPKTNGAAKAASVDARPRSLSAL